MQVPALTELLYIMASQDELTATVFGAVQSLSNTRKANLLLDTALALIGSGQCVDIVWESTRNLIVP